MQILNQTTKESEMALNFKDTASVLVEGNKAAFKANAARRAGQIFNERVRNAVVPQLPMMAKMYADKPWFQFILANAVAGAVIKFGHTNDKLLLLADAGVQAANDEFLGSFDLEGIVNGLIDGIDTSGLTAATEDVRGATSTVLRKAADMAEPTAKEA